MKKSLILSTVALQVLLTTQICQAGDKYVYRKEESVCLQKQAPKIDAVVVWNGAYGPDTKYDWEGSMDQAKNYKRNENWRLATFDDLKLIAPCIKNITPSYLVTWTSSREAGRPIKARVLGYNEEYSKRLGVSEVSVVQSVDEEEDLIFIQGVASEEYKSSENHISSRRNREAEILEAQDRSYKNKTLEFRKNLKSGDESTLGVVIEVNAALAKVQTEEQQCSQKNYSGECINWINTSSQKWFKKNMLFPPK